MAQKSIAGTKELARKIKQRRNELNLTIEEAARRANVGTKTWSRYEAGEAIRWDKSKGICRALNWIQLPEDEIDNDLLSEIEIYKTHEAWSSFLEEAYGTGAAASFAIGSDILLDHIEDDMAELSRMPAGSHIGQLNTAFIRYDLPSQFITRYDYEFMYQMKCALCDLRRRAQNRVSMYAHSVLEELLYFLCNEEAKLYFELMYPKQDEDIDNILNYDSEWIFDMFDDGDIITFLYSNYYLNEDHPFHFKYWGDRCFYLER